MPAPPRHFPPPTPLPPPLARLAASVYGAVVGARNRRFDQLRGVVELDRPVISIGNLSTGGTGKTPMVRLAVSILRGENLHPAVAMRGYAAPGGDSARSDEALDYRDAFPDLPLVAQPNRTDGLIELFATPMGERVDCVILDDGFQHRRLARALDVVLIDSTRDPYSDRLLPAGWLREPIDSLRRAHAIVLTHAEAAEPRELALLKDRLARDFPRSLLAACRHVWEGLLVVEGGVTTGHEPAWLAGKRAVAACAIGNPDPFLAELARVAGRPPVASLVLPDHDPYAGGAVRRLLDLLAQARPDALVVTSKDWAKLRALPKGGWPCPVVVPALGLAFESGGEALRLALLHAARQGRP